MTARRLLNPKEIAEQVVAELRNEGHTDYPFIPADLDEEIVRWCAVSGVEPQPSIIVREEMATLPGVERLRVRLNRYDPEHRYIRRRQRARGEENDRPTVYVLK